VKNVAFTVLPLPLTATILWPFVQYYPGEPVQEETFTNWHLFWQSTILYLACLASNRSL